MTKKNLVDVDILAVLVEHVLLECGGFQHETLDCRVDYDVPRVTCRLIKNTVMM